MKQYIVRQIKKKGVKHFIICDKETLKELQEPMKYLKHKKRKNCSFNTIKRIAYALCYYYKFLEEEKLTVRKVLLMSRFEQDEHFQDYLRWLRAGLHCEGKSRGRSNNTCNSYLESVFGLYLYLIAECEYKGNIKVLMPKQISYSNSKGIRFQSVVMTYDGYLRKEHASKRKNVSKDSISILLNACTNLRNQILILLLAETGFRIGEILGLKYKEDIDYENRTVRVRYRERNSNDARAKYAEERIAKISNETFEALIEYIEENRKLLSSTDHLFVNLSGKNKGAPLTYNAVCSMYNQLEKKTGKKVSSHNLRHYFANERRKSGWDIPLISQSLGHKSIVTTMDYLNIESDELMMASDRFYASYQHLLKRE